MTNPATVEPRENQPYCICCASVVSKLSNATMGERHLQSAINLTMRESRTPSEPWMEAWTPYTQPLGCGYEGYHPAHAMLALASSEVHTPYFGERQPQIGACQTKQNPALMACSKLPATDGMVFADTSAVQFGSKSCTVKPGAQHISAPYDLGQPRVVQAGDNAPVAAAALLSRRAWTDDEDQVAACARSLAASTRLIGRISLLHLPHFPGGLFCFCCI